MVLELLMEVSVHLVSSTKWYYDRWVLVAVMVTACSWLSIISPVMEINAVVGRQDSALDDAAAMVRFQAFLC